MKTLYIADCTKNLIITNETFLIISCEKAEDKNGKTYCKLVVGDKTGKMDAKLWAEVYLKSDKNILKSGAVVMVSAKVEEYKGSLQMNILEISGVDETKLDDFLESSIYDPEEMMTELQGEINQISDQELKKVLNAIINDKSVNSKLKFWPAGNSIHHGFRSGLLQHVLEMISMSKGVVRFYPEIDYDILLAGIILHDIGKIYELDGSGISSSYTVQGSLIGHIVLGAMLFNKFAEGKISEEKRIHITHLILSHHETKEKGSPVQPSTIEAFMLTYLDLLSSKAKAAEKTMKSIPEGDVLSKFNPWIGGVMVWNGKLKEDNEVPTEGNTSDNLSEESTESNELPQLGF